jgi:hypothetical protein
MKKRKPERLELSDQFMMDLLAFVQQMNKITDIRHSSNGKITIEYYKEGGVLNTS